MGEHAANEVERICENVLRGLAFSLLRDFNEKWVLIIIIEYISLLTNNFTESAGIKHARGISKWKVREKIALFIYHIFLRDIYRHWILKL